MATHWPHRAVEALDLRLPDVPWATLAVVEDMPGDGERLFIGATGAICGLLPFITAHRNS